MMEWALTERPGYLGSLRDEMFRQWDNKHGEGNWRLRWRVGSTVVGFLGACALYEDAYMHFLKKNSCVVAQLRRGARNIYDDAPSNVASGLNYGTQETGRTHIQDIAIRNCLVRMGVWFNGTELIQIRDKKGVHPLSMTLSPGRVPFHKQGFIVQPELEGWWDQGSVEAFYQSNRYLEVLSDG